jgi:hypothetical protein
MNNKYKNYGLWLALFSLIGLILRDTGLMFDSYGEYVELLMYILIALGVVSNPSLGNGYKDKNININKGDDNNVNN